MRTLRLGLLLAALVASLGLAAAQADEATLLLALPTACRENWSNVTANMTGSEWAPGTPPCGADGTPAWKGVTCDAQGRVVRLEVANIKLRCTGLPPELAALPALQYLNLKCNALTGGIPPEWRAAGAFPALQHLNLADNVLQGSLDDFTMAGSGMMASRIFNISRNGFDNSPLPTTWRSPTLRVIDVSLNRVPGPLPAAWGEPVVGQRSAFPNLDLLSVHGNALEGPYDPWASLGGGQAVFAPNFTAIVRPGNGLMEGVPTLAAQPADTQAQASSTGGDSGLSTGAIVGIAVGAAAGVALAAALAVFVMSRRRRTRAAAASAATSEADAAPFEKGWGKDLEAGSGGVGSAGGSAWSAQSGGPPGLAGCAAAVGSGMRDSAMGSAATSVALEQSGSGSTGRLSGPGCAADTDTRRLPADWSTVAFSELELGHVLGQGSFGCVRLAKYCQTTVAVKMLGADKASDAAQHREVVRQLEKEAAIMSKLRHTNVCLLMGACQAPPCLLMEYCSRRSVDKIIHAGLKDNKVARQLSWGRLLTMVLDAAKGMVYLHARQPPVCHRDLKSANLLVTQSYQVKVADFNLSRALEEGGMSSVVIQNPRWLAPERLEGGAGGLSSDVWSFGTVLWELMTWEHPFEGLNSYQIIHAVQGAPSGSGLPVPPPWRLPAGTLGQYTAYVALMEACWERDPAKRPSMEEVATRLRAILTAEVGRSSISGTPSANELSSPAEGTEAVIIGPSGGSGGSGSSPFAPAAAGSSPFEAAAADASPFAAAAAVVRQPSEVSPFAAAAAVAHQPSELSPFAAAAAVARQPSELSPFAAAAAVARQPSELSPFAAAAAVARQPSTALPLSPPQSPPPGPQAQPSAPGTDAAFDSSQAAVLASFTRMEETQRQLSRQASRSSQSPGLSRATSSGLGSGRRTASRANSGKGQAAP